MTWGQLILCGLFLTVGTAEIITNLGYLLKKNGLKLARRQHKELPVNVSDQKIQIKVICMLLTGIVLFISSFLCYFSHMYLQNAILSASILLFLYGITEAFYYKPEIGK